ncbi:hypothetical protein U2F10_03000 [Leptothoe sp. EHU-05/26/07-4]
MAILSIQDLATYAPELDLDPGVAQGAILQAEMLAQGPQGSQRPLSKQPFVETPRVGGNGIARLTRWPIDPDADFTVETRYYATNRIAYSHSNDWVAIEESEYTRDLELGEVSIHGLIGHAENTFSTLAGRGLNHPGIGGYRSRSAVATRQAYQPQVRVAYTAGFDFQADPLSEDALQIKTAVAAILSLQQSPLASGLRQETLTDFKSVTYGSDTAQLTTTRQGSTLMSDYLAIMRQYRAREYAS